MVKPAILPESGPFKKYAVAINRLNDAMDALRIQPGLGYSVRRSAHGQVLNIATQKMEAQEVGGLQIKRFRVTEVRARYLICEDDETTAPGDPNNPKVNVAKPWYLRMYPGFPVREYPELGELTASTYLFQGVPDYNYRKLYIGAISSNNKRFIQRVFPVYETNVLNGNTKILAIESYAAEQTESLLDVNWMDLNVDARRWEVPMKMSSACREQYNTSTGYTTTSFEIVTPYNELTTL